MSESKRRSAARVEAESLLAKSRAPIERSGKPTSLPGGGPAFLMVALTGDEMQLCKSRAYKRFDDLQIPVDHRYQIDFEEEVSWQMLWECMRDPEAIGRHFAKDTDEVRKYLSEEERDVLVDELLDHMEDISPDTDNLSPAIADAILADIKKKEPTRLANYGSRSLRYFLQLLASRPEISTLSPFSTLSSDTDEQPEKTPTP